MTIKEAFQKLSKVTNAGVKNPWFVIRNLGQTFADVADKISYNEMITSKKLWENDKPTTAFPATDVTVDNSADFDAFIVVYSLFSWSGMSMWFIDKPAINDTNNHTMFHNYIDNTNGVVFRSSRAMKLTQAEGSTSLKFAFAGGNRDTITTYGTAATSTANNGNMIPEYIIGIKFNS